MQEQRYGHAASLIPAWMAFAHSAATVLPVSDPVFQGASQAWFWTEPHARSLVLIFDFQGIEHPVYPDLARLRDELSARFEVRRRRGQGLHTRILFIADTRCAPLAERAQRTIARRWSDFAPVHCWTLDIATGHSDEKTSEERQIAGEFRDVLTSPAGDPAAWAQRLPVPAVDSGWTVATWGLIAALVAVYVAQASHQPFGALGLGNSFELAAADLIVQGGITTGLVAQGQWFRLLTAPLMHTGIFHLFMNCVAIFMVGQFLERNVGRAWFLATFFGAAWIAALASSQLLSPDIVSVGASGGALGLFGAAVVLVFHYPAWAGRTQMMMQLLQVLIPSLLSVRVGSMNVDVAAHVAGALAGALIGIGLHFLWPASGKPIRGRHAAAILTGGAVLLSAWGGYAAFSQRADWDAEVATERVLQQWRDRLVPPERLPEFQNAFEPLRAEFPDDPRVRIMAAGLEFDAGDYTLARDLLTPVYQNLAEVLLLFPDGQFDLRISAILGASLYNLGDRSQAREVLGDSCENPALVQPEFQLLRDLCAQDFGPAQVNP